MRGSGGVDNGETRAVGTKESENRGIEDSR